MLAYGADVPSLAFSFIPSRIRITSTCQSSGIAPKHAHSSRHDSTNPIQSCKPFASSYKQGPFPSGGGCTPQNIQLTTTGSKRWRTTRLKRRRWRLTEGQRRKTKQRTMSQQQLLLSLRKKLFIDPVMRRQ